MLFTFFKDKIVPCNVTYHPISCLDSADWCLCTLLKIHWSSTQTNNHLVLKIFQRRYLKLFVRNLISPWKELAIGGMLQRALISPRNKFSVSGMKCWLLTEVRALLCWRHWWRSHHSLLWQNLCIFFKQGRFSALMQWKFWSLIYTAVDNDLHKNRETFSITHIVTDLSNFLAFCADLLYQIEITVK